MKLPTRISKRFQKPHQGDRAQSTNKQIATYNYFISHAKSLRKGSVVASKRSRLSVVVYSVLILSPCRRWLS